MKRFLYNFVVGSLVYYSLIFTVWLAGEYHDEVSARRDQRAHDFYVLRSELEFEQTLDLRLADNEWAEEKIVGFANVLNGLMEHLFSHVEYIVEKATEDPNVRLRELRRD